MAKMTDMQRAFLEAAVQRVDGAAVAPAGLGKSTRSKMGASMVARKLMREIRQKGDLPIWRVNEDGRNVSLVLTRAGRDAVSIAEGAGDDVAASGSKLGIKNHSPSNVKSRAELASRTDLGSSGAIEAVKNAPASFTTDVNHAPVAHSQPRVGSKQALLVEMISKPEGATIEALINATGWLPHTTRAALTGLRKRGFAIQRITQQGAPSLYMIAAIAAGAHTKVAVSRV